MQNSPLGPVHTTGFTLSHSARRIQDSHSTCQSGFPMPRVGDEFERDERREKSEEMKQVKEVGEEGLNVVGKEKGSGPGIQRPPPEALQRAEARQRGAWRSGLDVRETTEERRDTGVDFALVCLEKLGPRVVKEGKEEAEEVGERSGVFGGVSGQPVDNDAEDIGDNGVDGESEDIGDDGDDSEIKDTEEVGDNGGQMFL
ncbi:hypothetical protein BDP27DRAFT_1367213 [Rhodocollybia butyracea]|uniref:Uncharacterized protein n=1 Tax=Rhodocollybia butyracea TaxID=206335 RepID=A0A9P5PJJ1_9AGAR|nr:hypothetical protein BDP27DRAFT_1367213 [Rhodocollybia butyracea]